MSQTPLLVQALKKALKNEGKTYLDVAKGLGLSEASVKRMFATNHFTLQRLDAICQLIKIDFSDLVRIADESKNRISHLTEIQENELVNNKKLMLVAVCVRNRWRMDDIIKYYEISETECIGLLAKLDQLKLIELLPGNRFKLRIRPDFRWLPNGPIEHYFRKQIQREFFDAKFSEDNEIRLFLTGMLSRSSIEHLLRKLNDLAKEFSTILDEDLSLPVEKRRNIGLVLAFRPWELSVFSSLRKLSA
ncbi:helix-turn-helix domain-containing protein [Kaarinaea lacus]